MSTAAEGADERTTKAGGGALPKRPRTLPPPPTTPPPTALARHPPPPTAPPPCPAPLRSLHDLLLADTETGGSHTLVTFLTTSDLLRLSECCLGLQAARTFLLRVKIATPPQPSTAYLQALLLLLEAQQFGIRYLRLTDPRLLPALGLAPWRGKPASQPVAGIGAVAGKRGLG